jgi:hypothetical protein
MDKDKKNELLNLMKQYVDESNCIDISRFHSEHAKEYALLPHYFGSVNQAIAAGGWIKVSKPQHKGGKGMILRDTLAYEMLKLLRNGGKVEKQTLEEIAGKYDVTRPAINQLFKALDKAHKNSVKEDSEDM